MLSQCARMGDDDEPDGDEDGEEEGQQHYCETHVGAEAGREGVRGKCGGKSHGGWAVAVRLAARDGDAGKARREVAAAERIVVAPRGYMKRPLRYVHFAGGVRVRVRVQLNGAGERGGLH